MVERIQKLGTDYRVVCTRDALGLLLILWCVNPEQRFYNWWIYGALLAMWIATAFLTEPIFCIKKLVMKPHILALFIWPIVRSIYACFGKATFSIYLYTVPFIFILFWFYLNQEKRIRELYLEIILIYYVLINCGGIVRLIINPNISRLLANGDIQKTEFLASPFTANYYHIYTLTFLVVACVGLLKYQLLRMRKAGQKIKFSRIQKELCAIILSGIVVIFMSQYTYAILFVIVFSIFVLLFRPIKLEKREMIYLMISIVLGCIILFSLLYILATVIDNKYILERFNEVIRLVTKGELSEGKDLYKRFHLYFASIKTFLDQPLFGVGGKTILESTIVGGHSEFLDCLAYYGLVGFISFTTVLLVNFKKILNVFPKATKNIYIVVFLIFIVQSIINTCYGEQILIGLYVIIPLLILEETSRYTLLEEGAK